MTSGRIYLKVSKYLQSAVLLCLVLLLQSCEKDIMGHRAVYTIEYETKLNDDINEIQFQDNNTGYYVTDNGDVKVSFNGGESWQELNTPGYYYASSKIYFFDQNNAISIFSDKLYRTANGGSSWTVMDEANYFVVDDNGDIYWNYVSQSSNMLYVFKSSDHGLTKTIVKLISVPNYTKDKYNKGFVKQKKLYLYNSNQLRILPLYSSSHGNVLGFNSQLSCQNFYFVRGKYYVLDQQDRLWRSKDNHVGPYERIMDDQYAFQVKNIQEHRDALVFPYRTYFFSNLKINYPTPEEWNLFTDISKDAIEYGYDIFRTAGDNYIFTFGNARLFQRIKLEN